jgi:hypothetical protein
MLVSDSPWATVWMRNVGAGVGVGAPGRALGLRAAADATGVVDADGLGVRPSDDGRHAAVTAATTSDRTARRDGVATAR